MSQVRRRRGLLRIALIASVMAVVVAACGGATASVAPSAAPPSPTATVSPSPSPSPADVSAAFLKIIAAPDFSAVETFDGTIKVGASPGTISGSGVITGGDSNETLTINIASTKQVTDSVSVGSTSWTKREPGPWLEDPKLATPKKTFSDYLSSLTTMVDLGLAPRPGRLLHHLRASGGNAIPAEYIGFGNDTGTKDAAFTVDFYATDDGTPVTVALTGTWTAVNGDAEAPASMTYEDTLSQIGSKQTVVPPDDVWVRYTSKALGYTMAHPADWTVTTTKSEDTYAANGQVNVFVAADPYKGTAATFVAALRATYLKQLGKGPKSAADKVLGGQPAARLVYDYTNKSGQPITIVDDVTVHGGKSYEVFVVTLAGNSQDLDTFDEFVATFQFTP